MKFWITILIMMTAVTTAFSEDRYVTAAFEISPPEPGNASGVYQQSTFSLPTADGFQANVGVQLQEYDGTMEGYEKISLDEFKEAHIQVIHSEVKGGIFTIEYNGKMSGYDLHWYARAFKKGKTVYLITGVSLATRWKTDGPSLIKSVNSFKLK